ncbi:hypothetical protein BGX24_008405 [Mortierella sp. AD032]|nr:hypothetical protein BGX24_008405 [Mortierella sp. AD032]
MTWPAKCTYGTDTLYNCPGPMMKPVVNQTCEVKRCLQEGKEGHCMVDCELEVHAGIYSGKDYGSVWYIDLENNGTYEKLADSKGTGAVWGIAVNKQKVEMKSSRGVGYRGTSDNYWDLITVLNQSLDVHAYGSRKSGQFIYASSNNGGAIWIHDDPPNAAPLTAKFTNLAGNSQTFCSDYFACIQDIAYDGNDYAWVIDGQVHLFISTQRQDSNMGGPMKHIGLISNYPGGNSFGIAFDAFGHVYYAGTVNVLYK